MTIFEFVQGAIIAIVVAASALHVARKLFPKWIRNRQAALANALSNPARASFVRRLGNFMQPSAQSGGGCGSGCSTCSTCDSNPQKETQAETKPLEFQRHI
jgi:hypothetical protein